VNPTLNPTNIAGVLTAAFLMSAPLPTHAETDVVQAVTTPGSGWFKRCRWPSYKNCITRHVRLPERVAVGDAVELNYGSNHKHYVFHVVRIQSAHNRCTVLSDRSGAHGLYEKIEIDYCHPALYGDHTK
jgi:hypothetical protein